jgi:hypothetical protein
MRKSHFGDEFLVLLGIIISRFFACSNEEKKQERVLALGLSLWFIVQATGQRQSLIENGLIHDSDFSSVLVLFPPKPVSAKTFHFAVLSQPSKLSSNFNFV